MAQQVDSTISFCTLDEARAQVLLPEEHVERIGKLADICNTVAKAMETYCGRRLKKRAVTEILDGDGGRVLFLSDFPVASSPLPLIWADPLGYGEFVSANQLTVWPGTGSQRDYQVALDFETGMALRIDDAWPKAFQSVKVTATVGIDGSNAWDLKQAQLQWIAQYWAAVGRDPSLASRSVLGMSMSYDRGSGDDAYALAPETRLLLDPHRKPSLAS